MNDQQLIEQLIALSTTAKNAQLPGVDGIKKDEALGLVASVLDAVVENLEAPAERSTHYYDTDRNKMLPEQEQARGVTDSEREAKQ